jgi:hypothetical protein
MTWEECVGQGWERDRIANDRFWELFEEEKTKGHSVGEAARRVCCITNAGKLELSRKRDAGEISEDSYIDGVAVLIRIGVEASRMWNWERSKALRPSA